MPRSAPPCTTESSCREPSDSPGLKTDLFDATDLAVCRMYQDASVRSGTAWPRMRAKRWPRPADRTDDADAPRGARCCPWYCCWVWLRYPGPWPSWALAVATAACGRGGNITHGWRRSVGSGNRWRARSCIPLGVLFLVTIQWYALARNWLGRPANWKGRAYPAKPVLRAARWSDESHEKIPTRTITLDDRPINLTQVLKLAGCVQSGGEAKMLIAAGQVKVNGQVELRKRCQMKAGDKIAIDGGPTIVLLAGAPPEVETPEDDPAHIGE